MITVMELSLPPSLFLGIKYFLVACLAVSLKIPWQEDGILNRGLGKPVHTVFPGSIPFSIDNDAIVLILTVHQLLP